MMRQVTFSSRTRSSWHFAPMDGSGREWGSESISLFCSDRSIRPASMRACSENGGVFTSPESHTTGFSTRTTGKYITFDISTRGKIEAQPEGA